MKRIILFLTTVLFTQLSWSQTSGGPDAYGYTWRSSLHTVNPPTFNWVDITTVGTLVTGLGDDNFVGPFTGSAGFQYYWYTHNQFYIGSNGFISFNGVNIASPFPLAIPDPTGPNDFIAPLLSDLNPDPLAPGQTAQVYYYSNTDSLVVSFINVPFWAVSVHITGSNTFQIILDKNDNSITYNYLSLNMGTVVSHAGIIGIENITGTLGLTSMVNTLPQNNLTIKYYYPAVVNFPVTDAGVNWIDNAGNGGLFKKKGGIAEAYTANIKNFGNQPLTNITVYDTIRTITGTAVSNGSATISALAPGQDTTVVFSNAFSPPAAATFRLNVRTQVTGDMIATNNGNYIEINAIDTAVNIINLDYSDLSVNGAGLNWNGGNGGIGVYFEPPIYPAKVHDTRYFITAVGAPAPGFYAIIYDDNGANGGPGTILDSVFVQPGQVTANQYTNVTPSQQIIILSGGVYVFWGMGGAGVALGRNTDIPIGRRSFEVLGANWSTYRSNDTEEFLLGLRITYASPKVNFNMNLVNDPTIDFLDVSTNNPTSWFWEFGDGGTDTIQHPSHTYIDNDTFNVCLTATNQYGSGRLCKNVIIRGNVPNADFTYNASSAPLITFFDESTNDPTAWHWDFNVGPGDTSNLQNTAYNYKSNGIFNVCLIAENSNGPSSPYCEDVEITGIGIDELKSLDVSIFPNPISNSATVILDMPAANDVELNLFDMKGNRVQVRIIKNSNEFNLYKDNLPSGQYILELTDQRTFVMKKAIQFTD